MANGTKINEENYRSLQREIINTQNKLSDLKNETSKWVKTGDKLTEWGKNLEKISQKIDNLGNKLTTRLTVPITTAFGAAIKEAIDFESAFTGVEKTVDGTVEQMNELKQGIKNLAKEIPSTTTEISAVAEAAGQLGIATDDILEFSKVMIDLGNSTNLSSDEAASALAKFANITKMSSKDYSKLGATIVELGNNFATTESDIVSMATRLAATGDLTGLTQSQILSLATAMSSVGIEAEAGGSAMSKLLKRIQVATELGGEDLDQFASVAGLSSEKFTRAFKEDAIGALSMFIKGLNDTKRNGKSAIAILDDMKIKEVRLSNTILSLANSGELMTRAVNLGNKAWKENTALINEANKRYNTTESQLKTTKNQIKDIAMSLGNKLLPIVKQILKKINDWTDKLDRLSDAEKDNIVKIGLMVAAAGPLLKIGSSAINIVSQVSSGIGTFTKAIALAHNGIGTATGSSATLAKALQTLTSPVGLATMAVVGLTAATLALAKEHIDSITGLNGLREEVNKQTESWNKLKQTREENIKTYSGEIIEIQKLADELNTIVDENGKIKEGYELRAQYITGKLSESLGTEIKLNGNIINQYSKIKEKVNELILAKKAEALMNAYQEEYEAALKKQTEATKTLIDLKQQQKEKTKELVTADAQHQFEIRQTLNTLTESIQKQTGLIGEYGYTIENYENLQTASVSGSAEKIQEAVDKMGISWEQAKKQSEDSIEEQLLTQALYVEGIKDTLQEAENLNNTYQANILKSQKKTNEKKLEELKKSLVEQKSTIEKLSNEQIKTWKTLAQNSFDTYKEVLKELPIETANKIQDATGVVAINTSFKNAVEDLGEGATIVFGDNLNLRQKTLQEITETYKTIDNDTKISDSAKNMANAMAQAFKKGINGNEWGKDLIEKVSSGMTNPSSKTSIINAANKVASWIKERLGFSLPEKGPLSDFDKSMPDMIDLMVKGINESKPKLENSINDLSFDINKKLSTLELFNSKINSNIVDSTKTIFTTPQITFNVQKMNKENLDECVKYINKKFGSAY